MTYTRVTDVALVKVDPSCLLSIINLVDVQILLKNTFTEKLFKFLNWIGFLNWKLLFLQCVLSLRNGKSLPIKRRFYCFLSVGEYRKRLIFCPLVNTLLSSTYITPHTHQCRQQQVKLFPEQLSLPHVLFVLDLIIVCDNLTSIKWPVLSAARNVLNMISGAA